jgi:transcription antitermination factor NusG
MGPKTNWYVVYTKPRWEKKVDALLREQNIIAYCPLNKVRRKWSDRYKVVEEPLFKGYVFVRVDEKQLASVRMINGILNFVYWCGRPAVVREQEIAVIQKFMNEYEDVQAIPYLIELNKRVVIKSGLLMSKEGEVVKIKSNIVEVEIDSLGYKLIAQINKKNLVPIADHIK